MTDATSSSGLAAHGLATSPRPGVHSTLVRDGWGPAVVAVFMASNDGLHPYWNKHPE